MLTFSVPCLLSPKIFKIAGEARAGAPQATNGLLCFWFDCADLVRLVDNFLI